MNNPPIKALEFRTCIKFFLNLVIIFGLVLVIFNIVLYKAKTVYAHKISDDTWIEFNGEDLLVENPIPADITGSWAEHVLRKDFDVNQTINVKIIKDALKKINTKEWTVEWVSAGNRKEGEEISLIYQQTGNYLLDLTIYEKDTHNVLLQESFSFIVGESVPKPEILINDENKGNSFLLANATDTYNLSVLDYDLDKYSYKWFLPDSSTSEAIYFLDAHFSNINMPYFIVLRKTDKSTNVYSEDYIKIAAVDNNFRITPPSIKIDESAKESKDEKSNIAIIAAAVLLGFSSAILIATIFWRLKAKKRV